MALVTLPQTSSLNPSMHRIDQFFELISPWCMQRRGRVRLHYTQSFVGQQSGGATTKTIVCIAHKVSRHFYEKLTDSQSHSRIFCEGPRELSADSRGLRNTFIRIAIAYVFLYARNSLAPFTRHGTTYSELFLFQDIHYRF